MAHHSYEKAKKLVFKGMWLLAIVTLLEVFISLLQKGHVISGLPRCTGNLYYSGDCYRYIIPL